MKHKRYGYTATRRVSLPAFSGGIDRSRPAHLIRDDRLHDALNVWWRDGMLCTRPALQHVATDTGHIGATPTVTSLPDGAVLYSKSGTKRRLAMLCSDGTVKGSTVTDMTPAFTVPEADGAVVYFTDGTVQTLGTDGVLRTATPYVPCVLSAGRATKTKRREDSGARTESINLLTPSYTCRYTTDGEGVYYWLPEGASVHFDAPFTVSYTVNGKTHTHSVPPAADVRRETGSSTDDYYAVYEPSVRCFYFTDKEKKPVALPIADAADNLKVSTECVHGERFTRLYKMTFGTRFAGRVFAAGHPNHPHRLHWSAVGDPLYFPENNDAFVGDASDAVTAFGMQDDLLVVFKHHSLYTVSERDGTAVTAEALLSGAVTDTAAVTTLFPIRCLHAEIGCPHPATVRLCGNNLVWMAGDGRVYALFTGGTYDARRVRPLSAPIEPLGQRSVSAARYGNRYLLMSERQCAVLDYGDAGISADPDRAVWFLWEFTDPVRVTDIGGVPYFFEGDTVWTLGDAGESSIPVRIVTKQYELGAERYKQICAVTVWAEGRATLTLTDGDKTVAMAQLTDGTGEPCRIPVAASRLKRCGLTLESDAGLALDRLQLVYRRMGEIRE